SSRSRHTRFSRDWSSDVCSSDLGGEVRRTRYIRDEKRTMYLRLDSTRSETITVHEADDCRRLSLSVAPGDEDRLDEVLGSSGLRSEERRGGKEGESGKIGRVCTN